MGDGGPNSLEYLILCTLSRTHMLYFFVLGAVMRTHFEPTIMLHAATALALSFGTQAVGFEGEVPPNTVVPAQT